MTKSNFMGKYPLHSHTLQKSAIKESSVDEIIESLKSKILQHPIATYITTFDHYAHTKDLNGEIENGMLDAKNIIFCFGKAIPNSQILAVRPRSIGVAEYESSFAIEFLEAPKEELQEVMQKWVFSLES